MTATRGPRVFLAGAFGQGNPGDEALLSAFAGALPDHVPVAASSDPSGTGAAHGVEAIGRHDWSRVVRTIARSEAVIVAGGTIFKTLHPASGRPPLALLRRAAAMAAVTRALRKPLALVGVGASSLRGRSAHALARAVVHAADLLVLRDEESAAVLAAIGAPTPIRVGADPAWTILPDPPGTNEPSAAGAARSLGAAAPSLGAGTARAPVVVALSHLAGGRDLGERLAAGLAPLVAAGLPVRLDPWQPSPDGALAADVANRLGGRAEIGVPPRDLIRGRAALAGARLVVAQRFHSLVAAAAAGAPALAVAHEGKLAGLARRLDQPAVEPDASPGVFAAVVGAALDGAPAALEAVRRERALAQDGFRLLRVLLARGRSEEVAAVDGLPLRPEEWLG
jgi:polysaccharide pyruvyl transferase WcaK-like protein